MNASNASWTSSKPETYLDYYQTTSYVVFGLTAGISSGVIMFVLCGNKNLWKKFTLFFWLVTSNLMSSVGMTIFGIVELDHKFHVHVNDIGHPQCFARLYPYMITIGRQTSSTIYVFLCLERVIAIKFPHHYNSYWKRRGEKWVYSLLISSIVVSIVISTVTAWDYEIPAQWACNPPSVFHPTYIKFQRYYPIFCNALSATLSLVMLVVYKLSNKKLSNLNRNGCGQIRHLDPVINHLVFSIVVATTALGFVPDTVYLSLAPTTPYEAAHASHFFEIFTTFYQVLPFANICFILLLHCWLVKDFRQALLSKCKSSKTKVINLRMRSFL